MQENFVWFIIIKFVRSIPYRRRAETQNCHSSAIKQKQSVTFLGNGINPPKNVALLFCWKCYYWIMPELIIKVSTFPNSRIWKIRFDRIFSIEDNYTTDIINHFLCHIPQNLILFTMYASILRENTAITTSLYANASFYFRQILSLSYFIIQAPSFNVS